jgi:chloramphenicol 3-O-phosphotransferase
VTPGTEVIVLNGGSSSGRSSLGRRLHEFLDGSWVVFGIDELLRCSHLRRGRPPASSRGSRAMRGGAIFGAPGREPGAGARRTVGPPP